MSEEQACLVQTRSDSETSSKLGSFGSIKQTMTYTEGRLTGSEGSGDPGNAAAMAGSIPADNVNNMDSNESGELIDYNETSVLAQFHEDALRQAGCGISQLRVLLATSLAVAGAAMELTAIPFILPSAEIEFCILPHEKSWLVLISVAGLAGGAAGWGALAERGGRRRALLSALAVNAVFASIAAVMPTYGTAMMARFCSAIGSGGIVPTSFAYLAEHVPRAQRTRALAPLLLSSALGVLLASALAAAMLPATGTQTLIENKEHFSAWHRYLLVCTLPILASLVSLIWTQESPRFLLEVGREVDAMVLYQKMHASNQIRVCGKKGVTAVNTGAEYRLGELELPGKRRPPALHHVRHSVKMFWHAFFQLFSSAYRTTTFSLGGTLFFAVGLQFYLSSYVPATVLYMENQQFEASKRTIENVTLTDQFYNRTIENVNYVNVTFVRCAFRDMFVSHVTFRNCSFLDVTFSNIKTSRALFRYSQFVNTSIIDTDMEMGRELDASCTFAATVVRGVRPGCGRRPDLTAHLHGVWRQHAYCAHAGIAAAVLAAPANRVRRQLVILGVICVLLSPSLLFAQSETALYVIEAVFRGFLSLIFFGATVMIVESFPASLRCTAHGLIMSVVYGGALAWRALGDTGLPAAGAAAAAALLAAAAAAAAVPLQPTHGALL